MAPDPVIFAMANPHPEVSPPRAKEVRPDSIVATGRSDYANQINNVMCFPFLFRGALDVRARYVIDVKFSKKTVSFSVNLNFTNLLCL